MITAVVIDDGRPAYLAQSIPSLEKFIHPLDEMILINDSGSIEYAQVLQSQYPQFDEQVHHPERRGLAGAVKSAWETALHRGADYVFHAEGDFTYHEHVDLLALARLLDRQPNLCQVCLMRQPTWNNDDELNAGGVVQLNPNDYTEFNDGNVTWTEHTRLFTFNPCLIPRYVIENALNDADNFLEAGVTEATIGVGYRSAYWGAKYDAPLCYHVGEQRSNGYRW